MKQTLYLIINAQSGDVQLRKNPRAGFGQCIVRLLIEMPEKGEIPTLEMKLPIPMSEPTIEASLVPYGVPWALSENIMRIVSISPEGQLQLDYTDDGLKRLVEESKSRQEDGWWGLQEYAARHWGLPRIYMPPERWEGLWNEPNQEPGVKP